MRSLEERGAHVHLNTALVSARHGHVVLSTGEEFDSGLIVWTAGNAANPMVRSHTDLPVDEGGLLIVRADLRAGTEAEPVPDAWGAGDNAAVPDLAADRAGTATVMNAQHAVRQGRLLADNIAATLRGREPKAYVHHSLGTIATLGLGRGIADGSRRKGILKRTKQWPPFPPCSPCHQRPPLRDVRRHVVSPSVTIVAPKTASRQTA